MLKIFDKFPKVRPELPLEYKKIYNAHYLDNREGNGKTTSVSKKMEAWMHKIVASDVKSLSSSVKTLEIGAGNLNHLQYEPNVTTYDVVEPYTELLDTSPMKSSINKIYKDIKDIDNNKRFDRIISIACFEHVLNLPYLIAQAGRLLNEKGQLRIAIPNEGTFLWKWGTMITGYEFNKKYGLDYSILMKHEHVNSANEIEAVLNFFFEQVTCDVLGISKNIAFYRFYICQIPDLIKIKAFLNGENV